MPGPTSGAIRVARLAGILAAIVMAGLGLWHASHGVTAWHGYQQWRVSDPSLADFFWTEVEIETALTTASAAAAALFGWLAWRGQRGGR